jgi:hypothetical protein
VREAHDELNEGLIEASLPCDRSPTAQIARWSYHQTEKANGQMWIAKREMKHLSPGWEQYLAR